LQHILVALPDTPSPDQIRQIQEKAEGIWSQLAQGQDFAQLAIRHSADAKALEGGNLGWLGLDEVPTFLEDTVLQLGEQEISQPIQSPLGFHILKLLGRDVEKQSAQLPADVEQQALRILRTQKGNQLYEQWLRRLRDEAFVTILVPEYQRD
jgi:peptidyl-prolyl cis-trans isomerase SurA